MASTNSSASTNRPAVSNAPVELAIPRFKRDFRSNDQSGCFFLFLSFFFYDAAFHKGIPAEWTWAHGRRTIRNKNTKKKGQIMSNGRSSWVAGYYYGRNRSRKRSIPTTLWEVLFHTHTTFTTQTPIYPAALL